MNIVQIPDPVLLQKTAPVTVIDKADVELYDLCQKLISVIEWDRKCAGLAAPQVGVSARVFAYCPSRGVRIFVNPSFKPVPTRVNAGTTATFIEETDEHMEGCKSVDHGYRNVLVKRYKHIVAEGLEVTGFHARKAMKLKHFRGHLIGWDARVWQHECDHLDGMLLGGADLSKPPGPKANAATIIAAAGMIIGGTT